MSSSSLAPREFDSGGANLDGFVSLTKCFHFPSENTRLKVRNGHISPEEECGMEELETEVGTSAHYKLSYPGLLLFEGMKVLKLVGLEGISHDLKRTLRSYLSKRQVRI